ncbi:MAG: LysR family transcriptional regulator [Halioglobus sp.]|jgi:DNA-binding transcriptional LysR family regulator
MDEPINWHDLEIFHAVLEQGSFSGAARVLGLSQPTVSRHIEGLERRLGRELFMRNGTGLEPSEIALDIGHLVAQMGDRMFAIQRTLDGRETSPAGIVTVSLPYAFGGIVLATALDGFHLHYPDISIDLKFGPPQSDLGRRETDIDLRWDRPVEPDVITRGIGAFHMGIFASERYLERYGRPEKPKDLNDHCFPYVDEPLMGIILESMARLDIRPTRFLFRCSGNTMLAAVLCLQGNTLNLYPLSLEPPSLQRVVPEYRFISPDFWLTMHGGLRRNRPIRAVWDWLVEHLPVFFEQTRSAGG